MQWLCQLKDGFMLQINGEEVSKVQTGYPYPDIEGGQLESVCNFLGVGDIDISAVVKVSESLSFPISCNEFKKALSGGGAIKGSAEYEANNQHAFDISLEEERYKEDKQAFVDSCMKIINSTVVNQEGHITLGTSSVEELWGIDRFELFHPKGMLKDVNSLTSAVDILKSEDNLTFYTASRKSSIKVIVSSAKIKLRNTGYKMYVITVSSDYQVLVISKDLTASKLYKILSGVDCSASVSQAEGGYVLSTSGNDITYKFIKYSILEYDGKGLKRGWFNSKETL